MQPTLDRALGEARCLAHLGVGQVVPITQDEQALALWRKGLQKLAQLSISLVGQGRDLRVLAVADRFKSAQIADGQSCLVAKLIDADMRCNGHQPATQRPIRLKRVEAGEGSQEGLLGSILGLGLRVKQPQCQVIDRESILRDEIAKRGCVALLGESNQIRINALRHNSSHICPSP